MARDKPADAPLSDSEISERMERALRRSFEMPPQPHKSKKSKERPASKGRVRKDRSHD
jgi:hypothetical protein